MSNDFNTIDAILDYKILAEGTDTADIIVSKLTFYYLNELRRLEEEYKLNKKTLTEYYERNLEQLCQSKGN